MKTGKGVIVNVSESENLEEQTNGQPNDFERTYISASQNQVIANNVDDQITRAVSSAVMVVKNRMHEAILTAIYIVVFPRVAMAEKSITDSTGHVTNSDVQNSNRRDFSENI